MLCKSDKPSIIIIYHIIVYRIMIYDVVTRLLHTFAPPHRFVLVGNVTLPWKCIFDVVMNR